LAFRFKEGIIVATDSRATAGNWIASQTVKKVIEIKLAPAPYPTTPHHPTPPPQ
jgi:ATP-dependent protease HslVU (ClpYQ) peptidase subunit